MEDDPDLSNEVQVDIKFVKSNFFRVIYADGAWGGVSPRGNIHISFYNERAGLPDSGTLILDREGRRSKQESIEPSEKIVREIECDLVIDLATAVGLRQWLDTKISDLNQLIKEAQAAAQRQRQQDEPQQKAS